MRGEMFCCHGRSALLGGGRRRLFKLSGFKQEEGECT